MNGGPCDDCEVEALQRVAAVVDALNAVLWAQVDPLVGVSAAIAGLGRARRALLAAGYEEPGA